MVWGNDMKKDDFNIMSDIKLIEELKAQLLCLIGEFYTLLTKGSNVAHGAILDCISGAIIALYLLADKLGYSYIEVDEDMKKKIKIGIVEEKNADKYGKDLTRLHTHLKERN